MEKQKNIPKLRFPEFKGEWKNKKYGDIFSFRVTNSFSRENLNYDFGAVKNIHYGDIHTKFHTLFDITKELVPFVNPEIDINRISQENYCKEGDLLIADASEDYNDVGKCVEIVNLNGEKVLAGLHTILARPDLYEMAIGFNGYLMKIENIRLQIKTLAHGSKVLSISTKALAGIDLVVPEIPEQQKIASFLISIDERLQLLKKKKSLLEQYKKGVVQKIFSQELRFKDEGGKRFPEWEMKKLGELLDYEQPTNYLVKSTDYDNSYKTPVLTAGKTFILGYTDETDGIFENDLPVIIFDDFTTATQFVDFPFKAKSSAMKILKARKDSNLKFIYELMQMIKYELGGHERHWISKFSELNVLVPSNNEQTKIANFLSAINDKISYCQAEMGKTEQYKKGLLQQMFC